MKSLRSRFTIAFLSLIIVIYTMFYVATEFFLEDFYFQKTALAMHEIEKNINNIIGVHEQSEERTKAIQSLSYNFEGNIEIVKSSGKNKLSSADIETACRAKSIEKREISGLNVFLVSTDYPVENTSWLVYSSLLKNGDILLAKSPISAISSTVLIIKRFINVIILISALIAIIIAIILSKNLSKPIKELNKMAENLKDLKFSKVYAIERKDEIGELSNTLLSLSTRLNSAIGALNNEINKDREINKIRQNFIAKASHELKTPITVIKNYIEALEDGIAENEKEQNSYYGIIDSEANKMSNMVNDLVQITLIESDDFKVNKNKFSLNKMLVKLGKDYSLMAEKKSLIFKAEIDETEISYSGDEVRLEQAFRNILNNAFKYSDNQRPINLSSSISENLVQISIENSGKKINEDDLNKVFDLFHKGESSRGSGIGLAVAANIFKKHEIKYFIYNTKTGVKFTAQIKVE